MPAKETQDIETQTDFNTYILEEKNSISIFLFFAVKH